jgi:Cu/Ag efflux protein CusF
LIPGPDRRARLAIAVVFIALLVALAVGIWGTVVRPPAYEVRGVVVARPSPEMLLVRHEAIAALGMAAMETMAVVGDPATIDAAGVRDGDEVRMAVRQVGADVRLIRIERVR